MLSTVPARLVGLVHTGPNNSQHYCQQTSDVLQDIPHPMFKIRELVSNQWMNEKAVQGNLGEWVSMNEAMVERTSSSASRALNCYHETQPQSW